MICHFTSSNQNISHATQVLILNFPEKLSGNFNNAGAIYKSPSHTATMTIYLMTCNETVIICQRGIL